MKKTTNKILVLLLMLALALSALAFTACTPSRGKMSFILNEDGESYTVNVLRGTATYTELEIPATYKNKPVTTIGTGAFAGSKLRNITIPNSITSIGENAFSCCLELTSITIPDSVTSIGPDAFGGCSNLESVTLGNGLKSIGAWAFRLCPSLTSISFPNSLTEIGLKAFSDDSSLTTVTLGKGISSIEANAFEGCSSIKNVYYTGDIAGWCGIEFETTSSNPLLTAQNLYIGSELIRDLVIPNTVTKIGQYAFAGFKGLISVTIPTSVTKIGLWAFNYCSNLSVIKYNGTVEQWDKVGRTLNATDYELGLKVTCTDGEANWT